MLSWEQPILRLILEFNLKVNNDWEWYWCHLGYNLRDIRSIFTEKLNLALYFILYKKWFSHQLLGHCWNFSQDDLFNIFVLRKPYNCRMNFCHIHSLLPSFNYISSLSISYSVIFWFVLLITPKTNAHRCVDIYWGLNNLPEIIYMKKGSFLSCGSNQLSLTLLQRTRSLKSLSQHC